MVQPPVNTSKGQQGPSKHWEVVRRFETAFTGGKAVLSACGTRMFGWCNEQVAVLSLLTGAVTRILSSGEEEQSDGFTAFCVSHDDSIVAVSCRSGMIRLLDAFTGEQLRCWRGHRMPVLDMAFDLSDSLLATCAADRTVRVWDISDGRQTHIFRGHEGLPMKVVWHPDVSRAELFSAGQGGQVFAWRLHSTSEQNKKRRPQSEAVQDASLPDQGRHRSTVVALTVSSDGSVLLTAGADQVMHVWSLQSDRSTLGRSSRLSHRRTLVIREMARHLALLPAADTDALKLAQLAAKIDIGVDEEIDTALTQVPVAQLDVCVVGEMGTLRKYALADLLGDTPSKHIKPHTEHEIRGGTITHLLWSRALCSAVCINEQQHLRVLRWPHLHCDKMIPAETDEIYDVAWMRNNLAVMASNSDMARVVHTGTGETVLLEGHEHTVMCVAAAAFGDLVATAGKDNTVRVWHVTRVTTEGDGDGEGTVRARCVAVARGHVAAVNALAFSHRKEGAFLVSGAADRTVKLWDIDGLIDRISDGESDGDRDHTPISLATKSTVVAHDKDVNCLAVSPDDGVVATGGGDKRVKLWHVSPRDRSLALLRDMSGHKRGIWDLTFSPRDRILASAAGDKTVRIWSLSDGTCRKVLQGHTGAVLRCVFLSQGTQLLTAGADSLLKLWTLRTEECDATFGGAHDERIWALAMREEGEVRVLTGGAAGRLCAWKDATQARLLEETQAQQAQVEDAQRLQNALRGKKWSAAMRLALDLERPRDLLAVLRALIAHTAGCVEARDTAVAEALTTLTLPQLSRLLHFAREWNTSARTYLPAQIVMRVVLQRVPLTTLRRVADVEDLLEAFEAYNDRHLRRCDRLLEQSYFVDYCCDVLDVIQ